MSFANVGIHAEYNVPGMDHDFNSAADENNYPLKDAPGNLYAVDAYNSDAGDSFIQFFDALTGDVTVGTTSPDYVIGLPGTSTDHTVFTVPLTFKVGMVYAVTAGPTNNTAPGATVQVSIGYK